MYKHNNFILNNLKHFITKAKFPFIIVLNPCFLPPILPSFLEVATASILAPHL